MKIYGFRKLGFIVFMILVVCFMAWNGFFTELVKDAFEWFSAFYLGTNVLSKLPPVLENFTIKPKA